MTYRHTPVMLKEVLEYLKLKTKNNIIDCTLGGGGYTIAIAKRVGKDGRVIAIDADEMAIENFQQKIKEQKIKNVILYHENFIVLSQIIKKVSADFAGSKGNDKKIPCFHGIVFDLGLSGAQLEDRNRGFSFQSDDPLDMAFGAGATVSTSEIINYWPLEKLTKIFRDYGEEKFAYKIAQNIIAYRKNKIIKTTKELADIIAASIPRKFKAKSKIHPATKVFQALRIVTNNELENLEKVLPEAARLLTAGGRIVVVSYHSLEDRIVKNFFKKESQDCLCPTSLPICQCDHKASLKIITKKPLGPLKEEVLSNPRSRSAKMRVAEKI
jgi:16S rRNA (cytosine1402-N4)-methyltransferase